MDDHGYKIVDGFGYALRQRNRLVVISICKGPKTVSEIAKDVVDLSSSQCQGIVQGLKKRGIIECINPEVKIGKIYALSEKGEKIVENMKKHKEYCLAHNLREDLYS